MALRVTDVLIRGGGGTITFSDNVTVEYIFQFKQDTGLPGGGLFDITLQGDRASLVYQTVVSQAVCDMINWVMQCSSLNHRVAILEQKAGIAIEFPFAASDWVNNELQIINTGPLGPGIIGAHNLGDNRVFHVTVFRDDGSPVFPQVDIEILVNIPTGQITIRKTGLGANFAGRVIIS